MLGKEFKVSSRLGWRKKFGRTRACACAIYIALSFIAFEEGKYIRMPKKKKKFSTKL